MMKVKVARIGNSRGIRIPVRLLQKYRIGQTLILEEQKEGFFLRKPAEEEQKLSWEETFQEMAKAQRKEGEDEDWSDFEELTAADGLDE